LPPVVSFRAASVGRMRAMKILVWDVPLRLFHWLFALSFAGAFVTAEAERYRDVHALLGYTMLALLAFRLVWAFVGTRYARLASFAFGPKAVIAYLRSLAALRPIHYVGHNPAGSWAIYALVALALITGASGYGLVLAGDGGFIEDLHEASANAMLALVAVHIAGVVVSSLMHRDNLVRAMITGYKRGDARDGIGRSRWPAAIALASLVAVLWSGASKLPGASPSLSPHGEHHAGHEHADDDD
jgi:cytochrome b